ncbi:MAG TPA: cbb3-type cytochrome oxidase assembly protein CcoS [Pseudomonadales bacterium]|nr:cbb3-type cytochrome oxidase assembly protein CcoS [Pseudomonadales bacterium]
MQSLYLIIPIALIFCGIAVAAWLWANNSGQYDDLDREARRIFEEKDTENANTETSAAEIKTDEQ